MLRTTIASALLFVCISAGGAVADPGVCQQPASVQAFNLDAATKAYYERQASFINLWWNSAEAQQLSQAEREKIRSSDIDTIYSKLEAERRDAYKRAACPVESTKKCASTPGNKHKCPMAISPPSNMSFVPSTLTPIDDDFDVSPTLLPSGEITYTVKKTGKGSNTAGFRAEAAFTPAYIDGKVKSEVDQVRAILDPMFKVSLQGTN